MNYQCTLPITEITFQNTQEKAIEIFDRSCIFFDLPKHVIISNSRKREIVSSRQMTMSALQKFTKLSLREIGLMFNGKDHTTVLHSKNLVIDLCDTDKSYRSHYEAYIKFLNNKQFN